MCDSSFEMELERVSSQKETRYDEVPADNVYKFKLKNQNNRTFALFEYVLKRGKPLPYSTIVKGSCLSF